MRVHVCVRVCVFVSVCARVCVCLCACVRVCVCAHACVSRVCVRAGVSACGVVFDVLLYTISGFL